MCKNKLLYFILTISFFLFINQAQAKTFVFVGNGFGHGVGLSQEGAIGQAKAKIKYKKIVLHYYQGTHLEKRKNQKMKVLLNGNENKVIISNIKTANKKTIKAKKQTFYIKRNKIFLKGYNKKAKTWILKSRKTFKVHTYTDNRVNKGTYRGTIHLKIVNNKIAVINVIDIEEYLPSVLPKEMGDSAPIEALKAQAVAARSYALAKRTGSYFDVYSDERGQMYGGAASETKKSLKAVKATKHEVLIYKNKIATGFFYASSGGHTESSHYVWNGPQVPYLQAVPDPYDKKHRKWKVKINEKTLRQKLLMKGKIKKIVVLQRGPGHRVYKIKIVADNIRTMLGFNFRTILGLKSAWFTVKEQK